MNTNHNNHADVKDSLEEVKVSISKLWDSVAHGTHMTFEKMADKTGKWFEEKKNSITKEDIHKVIDKAEAEIQKLLDSGQGKLQKLGKQAKLLFEMLRDSVIKNEFQIPWGSVAAITATLLYLISPIDIVPDLVPGMGLLDDAFVIALCISMVRIDLKRYAEHRKVNLADYGLSAEGKPLDETKDTQHTA